MHAENNAINLLAELLDKGFVYLRTYDDGETWRGTNSYGLKIAELLKHGSFCGNIVVTERDCYLIRVHSGAVPTMN